MKPGMMKWLEIFVEWVNYTVISYALSCMVMVFKGHWLFILFFAAQVWMLSKFYRAVYTLTERKVLSWVIWLCSVAVVSLLAYSVGYVDGVVVPFASAS